MYLYIDNSLVNDLIRKKMVWARHSWFPLHITASGTATNLSIVRRRASYGTRPKLVSPHHVIGTQAGAFDLPTPSLDLD